MGMVSNIGQGFANQFPQKWPHFNPLPESISEVSRAEFEALRREVQELKKLLLAAKKFDEATGQPDCEVEDKVKLIKAIAKLVGVDLGDVLEAGKKPSVPPEANK